MNANELAEIMMVFDSSQVWEHAEEIATMLRQLQAENEALKWKVNHLEQSVDTLRTTLFDIRCKYDTKTKQRMYSQVYVDELQAENDALKNARCVACGWNPKLIRPQVKEEND